MSKPMANRILIAGGLFVVFLCLGSPRLVAQRECCEGNRWLKWSESRREAFVDGFLIGYQNGYVGGCVNGTANVPPEAKPGTEAGAITKCGDEMPDFSSGTIKLVRAVTDFYQQYPGDRDIYIHEILEQLGKGLTLEQIHNHPFMRHHTSEKP
jgi:hypothetical protein